MDTLYILLGLLVLCSLVLFYWLQQTRSGLDAALMRERQQGENLSLVTTKCARLEADLEGAMRACRETEVRLEGQVRLSQQQQQELVGERISSASAKTDSEHLARQLTNLTSTQQILLVEIDDLKTSHQQLNLARHSAQTERDQWRTKCQELLDAHGKDLERQVGALQNQLTAAIRQHEISTAELRTAHQQELDRIRLHHRQEVERMAADHDNHHKNLRQRFDEMQASAKEEFGLVAAKLLDHNGKTFLERSRVDLDGMLRPMREKLHEFRESMSAKFEGEAKDKAVLTSRIEQLHLLNQELSTEARQLTRALKGDNKAQGDWGELQLERLLEAAGLQAGTHYDLQTSYTSDEGNRLRPDCIVKMPQGKCLIIDSKVSLVSFERAHSAETDTEIAIHLGEHVRSIRNHIISLSKKRYNELYQVNTPDYVLMFVPLEPAFIAAMRQDQSLFTEALERRIVLVSPSTLLATMTTVSYIWQQERQHSNAQQIAEIGVKLYKKFDSFVKEMTEVGRHMDRSRETYNKAMDRLIHSPHRNTTLVALANQLSSLGAAGKGTIGDLPIVPMAQLLGPEED